MLGSGQSGRAPPNLVIFDCDGVLVDSEPISIGVLVDFVRDAGHPIDEDEAYERFLGKSMAAICRMLADRPGIAVTDRHLETMRATLYDRFRAHLSPVSGIAEALDRIAVPRCVASSSQPERIALSLELTGLAAQFTPHIFSATMVERGKPAPDLFLHAAAQMGVQPGHALVIEDSPAGIEAAKRAGMRVFAFAGASHAGRAGLPERIAALEPDLIFDNMQRLPHLIGTAAA